MESGPADSELLVLASAWPQLECLLINQKWGWKNRGGITPDGLLRLLKTCRSFSRIAIAIAIDTRGYTDSPPRGSPVSFGLALPPRFGIDVLDSIIEAESVPAVAAFFASIGAPCHGIGSRAWNCRRVPVSGTPDVGKYKDRWNDIFERVNKAVNS